MSKLGRVSAEELSRLLALYSSIDDLAQDVSLGDRHEQVLPEIWGMVKALGEPKDGLRGYDAYALPAAAPVIVVESDGTILPFADWTQLANWNTGGADAL